MSLQLPPLCDACGRWPGWTTRHNINLCRGCLPDHAAGCGECRRELVDSLFRALDLFDELLEQLAAIKTPNERTTSPWPRSSSAT